MPNSTLIQPAAVYMLRVNTPGISGTPLSPNGVTAAWSPANSVMYIKVLLEL